MYVVLIETLWNVKALDDRLLNGIGFVLIETLWNVKMIESTVALVPVPY